MGIVRNGTGHQHVVADVEMRLINASAGDATVSTELHYSTRDPYAVQATFHRPQHAPVKWVFARDLLMVGTARPTGDGDVHVQPMGGEIVLTLQSPEGSAQLTAASAEIRRFCAQMLSVVPAGDEIKFVDVDAELARLDPAIFAGGESRE